MWFSCRVIVPADIEEVCVCVCVCVCECVSVCEWCRLLCISIFHVCVCVCVLVVCVLSQSTVVLCI